MKTKKEYLKYTENWHNLFSKYRAVDVERLALEISKHLNSGFSFSISRDEYNIMKNKAIEPTSVHYYFGISEEGKFKILILDNIADAHKIEAEILEKDLTSYIEELDLSNLENYIGGDKKLGTFENTISMNESLNRAFRWKLFSQNWLVDKFNSVHERLFFPLIVNPFQDLKDIFEPNSNTDKVSQTTCNHAHHFFGLKQVGTGKITNNDHGRNLEYSVGKLSNYTIDIIVTNITKMDSTKNKYEDDSCPCYPKGMAKKDYFLMPKFDS